MKILYAARFDDAGISSNTSQYRGLKKLGHTVLPYSTPHRQEAIGFRASDKEIVDIVREEKPDLVIFAKATGISIQVFKAVRTISPLCYWFPDPLVTYNVPEFIEKTKNCDYFCCDKENVLQESKKYNPHGFLVPDGFDAEVEYFKDLDEDIDVSFIGNLYGKRRHYIDQITKKVEVVSDAFGPKHSEITSRSKINLNFCTAAGASDRIYKLLGAKGFILSDDWVGREKTFKDGEHLVIFKDIDDLNEKIQYYLDNPADRERISAAGHKEVQKYTRDEWAVRVVAHYEEQREKKALQVQRRKVLIAGPWVGEFGWELLAWHAYIRELSTHYDETVCLSRATSEYLYEDFTTQFIPYEASGGLADSFFMHNHQINREKIQEVFKPYEGWNITWAVPKRVGNPPSTHFTEPQPFSQHMIAPRYIKFQEELLGKNLKTVVIHARARELRNDDNWEIENWNKFVAMLRADGYHVASIGTKTQASHIEGTQDCRGIPLKKTVALLSNAIVAIGPSSGPMHLASLCGCPHIVWSKKTDVQRYEENWNPHNTRVLFLGEYEWRPSPEYVYEKFKNFLLEKEIEK